MHLKREMIKQITKERNQPQVPFINETTKTSQNNFKTLQFRVLSVQNDLIPHSERVCVDAVKSSTIDLRRLFDLPTTD